MQYNKLIDHTLLKQDASPEQIVNLCEEAKKFVDFSYTLAEYHATKDLQQMKEEGIIDDELIRRIKDNPNEFTSSEVSFKITTNKEIIKFIRDNNLYMEGVSYK